MKKMLKSALALAMGAVMLMPVTAFAAEDEPTLISTQEVALSPSGANTRSAETKEFTLSTYEDNGRTVRRRISSGRYGIYQRTYW